ncbi:hypothetical protein CDIK_4448 [Cucumispora dikerogammari]|nr:hypothetical protein CDIK_4448 [Cucumispora dikerogammari]
MKNTVRRYMKTEEVVSSKRGGDRRFVLPKNVKTELLMCVDEKYIWSLKHLAERIKIYYALNVPLSTVDRALRDFHCTLKYLTTVSERRNCCSTIDSKRSYAANYRSLEVDKDDQSFIFIYEVGFSVVTRI